MNNWTEQEKWVWERIKSGEAANFNAHPKGTGELDPTKLKEKTEPWPEFRKISSRFLTDILYGEDEKGERYIDSVPVKGIWIIGAWFYEKVDIDGGVLERILLLDKSRFDEGMDALYIIAKGFISFDDSAFFGKLDLNAADIYVNLFVVNCKFKKAVNFKGMKVGGQVSMRGAKFQEKLAMDAIKVSGGLFMDDAAVFEGQVRLHSADIGGEVNMKKATFKQKLAMDGMKVGGGMFMNDGAVFDGEVRLLGADISGEVNMDEPSSKKNLRWIG